MIRTAIIASSLLAAPAAQACSIQVQSCTAPSGADVQYGGHQDAVVLFSEYGPAENQHASVVVECASRQALSISPPNADDWGTFWEAERVMQDAVFDDAAQTLRQVARAIRRETGIEARVGTLPAGHCGCELPNMPRPPSNCPVDF